MSNQKRLFVLSVAIVMIVGLASVAAAVVGKFGDPAPFPDTCNIEGASYYSVGSPGWTLAETREKANCARIQAKLRYKTTGGYYINVQAGWAFKSFVSTGAKQTYVKPAWSDHNGDNNDTAPAYGFRLNW